MKPRIELFLDSGAFSIWKSGKAVTRKMYADFLSRHHESLYCAANLDVIPERRDKPAIVEAAAQASWDNYVYLRKAVPDRLTLLPVYHYGEREYWLEKMLGEGCTHIGLGGFATLPSAVRVKWLDEVFARLCRPGGFPPVAVHGFAVTALPLMTRYPWTTVDSTSWQRHAFFGYIMIPHHEGDEYHYERSPVQVLVSHAPRAKPDAGKDIRSIGPGLRGFVYHYLDRCGLDFKLMAKETGEGLIERLRANIRFQREFEAHLQARQRPFVSRREGLFMALNKETGWGKSKRVGPFRLFFGHKLRTKVCQALEREKVERRLLSFYELKTNFDAARFVRSWRWES